MGAPSRAWCTFCLLVFDQAADPRCAAYRDEEVAHSIGEAHLHGPLLLGASGWRYQQGESALACARRELKEELALDGDFRQLGTVDVTHDFHRDLVRVFLVQNHCGEPQPNEAEIAEVRWFEFDHLPLNLTKLAHHILIDDTGLGWRKMQRASDVASS